MLKAIGQYCTTWGDGHHRQALAEAYVPIVRGFLVPGCAYYLFVTWGHWRDETGTNLAILASLSFITAISYALLRQVVLAGRQVDLGLLERTGLAINLLMYANVLVHMLVHFEPSKLIYFVLMAVVFSTSGVTLRVTLASIVLSIGTLFWLSQQADAATAEQYMFIGVAGSFAAFGMTWLLRKAVLKQIEARLAADAMTATAQDLARTDPLTSLPNRRSIFDELDCLIAAGKPFWFGVIDLDRFKGINDVYGHVVGDRLLVSVVKRLAINLSSEGVTLGRIGGDEFAVIVPDDCSDETIRRECDALIARLSEPFMIDLHRLTVGASAGFCRFPGEGLSGAELYERADYTLYKAKAGSRGRTVVFDVCEQREMTERVALERALQEHDLHDELYIVFQPQYSVRDAAVTGYEALARWNCAGLGAIRPDKFIEIAERSGRMPMITTVLFQKTMQTLANLRDDITLSFNLSAHDLVCRSIAGKLLSVIERAGVAPHRVEFEITETAVMMDLPLIRSILEDLRAAGCRIALDDFGSGYFSFRHIETLPLDKIKIDQSFVRTLKTSNTSREIVAGLLSLCQRLNLRSVIEGVETSAELEILLPLNPDLIQGYYFGAPVSAADVLAISGRRKARMIAQVS